MLSNEIKKTNKTIEVASLTIFANSSDVKVEDFVTLDNNIKLFFSKIKIYIVLNANES